MSTVLTKKKQKQKPNPKLNCTCRPISNHNPIPNPIYMPLCCHQFE